VNNIDIKNANDVVNAIGFLRVNSKATVGLLRKNKSISITVNLYDVKKRQEISQSADPFLYGLGLKNFSILSPIHGPVKGVLVASVDEDSNAWHANIIPGDVITSANEQPVMSVDDLKKIAASAKETLVLNILRGAGAVFLVINKEP
jgi:serine protease Do